MFFITGNADKFLEAVAFFPDLKHIELDLPEIQELDPHEIIKAKAEAAKSAGVADFIVEDTSLYFEGMNGLPGPLVKWFLQGIGPIGLYKLAQAFHIKKAEVRTVLGYSRPNAEVIFVEGCTTGTIVFPRGQKGFGWDGIFQPDGLTKTYGEMTREEKAVVNHRTKALKALAMEIKG